MYTMKESTDFLSKAIYSCTEHDKDSVRAKLSSLLNDELPKAIEYIGTIKGNYEALDTVFC